MQHAAFEDDTVAPLVALGTLDGELGTLLAPCHARLFGQRGRGLVLRALLFAQLHKLLVRPLVVPFGLEAKPRALSCLLVFFGQALELVRTKHLNAERHVPKLLLLILRLLLRRRFGCRWWQPRLSCSVYASG